MKTAELSGKALDWAVCNTEVQRRQAAGEYVKAWCIEDWRTDPPEYSTDWLRAGPIIEREWISILWQNGQWRAEAWFSTLRTCHGATPLEAAMRCYVLAKRGPEIELPPELLQENS